jgi:uncharacterized protein YgbK (DUF1537 family)|tara:strand:- start:371 stop:1720 length:1350 start_codon:yes stop_codon:yes gene_type:complete
MTHQDLLANLPPIPADDLLPSIREALESSERTIVVLDDDPTGTQTVFDVPVLTRLDADSIRDAIDDAPPVLFLLTNSRALTAKETTELHQNLGKILKEFADDIIVISRSDSTLRGHFPLETNILRDALGIPEAPTLFIPFFEAGGRLTVNNTHYVVEGNTATPAHLTPFANDNTFPFSHSHLPDYIAEKTGAPVDVQSISLEDLRSGNVVEKLASLPDSSTCIVNATCLRDLDSLSLALHQNKRRFIIRSAASFVQSLGGITSRPPLDPWQMQDLAPNPNGGLIIVGSHVPKTTAQLNHLLENFPNITAIELNVPDLLNSTFDAQRTALDIQTALSSGKTVVLFTSRDRIDGEDNLVISRTVSQALVSIVRSIKIRPKFLIAKGGITSSDIATDALGVKQAMVLGQILLGVPVWTIGNETRHPGLAYIIFPGNVGGDDALTQAYQKLTS